jgi:lipid A ethanolaminephosphotransferase
MKRFLAKLPAFDINLVIAIAALYITLANNQSFWSALVGVVDTSRPAHWLFLFTVLALIFSLLFILISLVSFKPVFKPALFIIIVSSAVIGYFMDAFGTLIDVHMIQNVMETDSGEAFELLSMSMLGYILLFGVLPAFVITRLPIRSGSWKPALLARGVTLVTVIGVTSLSLYYAYRDVSFIFREHKTITYMINPLFPMRALVKYYRDQQPAKDIPLQAVFSDARALLGRTKKIKPTLFVIVLGETARAGSFHINGYARNTTPRLEQENIINFSNTSSCGTATAISVPCIFSALQHDNYDDSTARHSENLLDALQRAGIEVLWRDNNSGCKGVCERVASENMHHLDIDDYCNEDGCFDEVLLYKLQDLVDNMKKDAAKKDAVIVLHQQGSHGPSYYKRYPQAFASFQPACDKTDVQNCSYQEIVNAYDNTILYTDYFLDRVIDFLKANAAEHDTAMLYVSDHGESLGENGIYLHGLPYMIAPEEQTRVPFMLWMSDDFSRDRQLDTGCLQQQQAMPHSHDNILHSVLGVMGVGTKQYRREQDIFSGCRGELHAHNSDQPEDAPL